MATQPESGTVPRPPPSPTIHEAERASGASGAILYDAEIELNAAIARRLAGLDVVVRGDDTPGNRRMAEAIESGVGPNQRSDPHRRAGPLALPHFQQDRPPPQGHSFYETAKRKARKKP